MKIVILGAGASFDSINKFHEPNNADVLMWKPPLGNDIFGSRSNFREIYNKYPGSSNLSHAISASADVEEYFQQKWDLAIKHQDKYTLANIISVQYCLQELFYTISENYSNDVGSSNYHILVQQAYDYHLATGEDVVFITFNYDLLLEYAVLSFFNEGGEINEDFYTKYPIKIFKPHGSCNWFKASYKYSKYELLKIKPKLEDILDNLEEGILVSNCPLIKVNSTSGNNPIFSFGEDRSNSNKIKHSFPQILIP